MLLGEIRSEIQKKWEAVTAPVTGYSTYEELRPDHIEEGETNINGAC